MSFVPPRGPNDQSDPSMDVAGVEEKVDKLAAFFHMEWCDSCGDWRDLGHGDGTQHPNKTGLAGYRQTILESQDFTG